MKRKSFIKTGWFKKKIDIPELKKEIEDYFDWSFVDQKKVNPILLFPTDEEKALGASKAITIVFSNEVLERRIVLYNRCFLIPHTNYYCVDNGRIVYSDSQSREFEWPIEDFKNWPEEIKNFILEFIQALEVAYYAWKEVENVRTERENNYERELKNQELEKVKSFFGEIIK